MIEEYPNLVKSGHIPACKNIKLLCERMMRDLDRSVKRGTHLKFNEEAAADICDFAEGHLTVHDYKLKHRIPWKLNPWQRFMFACWNGWRISDQDRDARLDRETGTRRFRRLFLLTAKGSGKSPCLSAILGYMMLADPAFYGHVCGLTEKQSRRPIDEFKRMLEASPDLASSFHIVGGRSTSPLEIRVTVPGYSGFLSTMGNKTEEEIASGPIMTFAAAEEYQSHKTDAVLNQLDQGTKMSTEPLTMILANAGKSERGPCYEEYRQARKMLRGNAPWEDDKLYMIYEVDEANMPIALQIEERESESDPEVPTSAARRIWIHANPGFESTMRSDVYKKELLKRKQGEAARREVERILFSKFVRGAGINSWMDDDLWREIVVHKPPVDENKNEIDLTKCPLYIGIDLATTKAFSSICLSWRLPDGKAYSEILNYLPGEDFEERVENVYRQPYLIQWEKDGYLKLMRGHRKTDWMTLADDLVEICQVNDVHGIAYDDNQAEFLMDACRKAGLHFEVTKDPKEAYNYPGVLFVDHPQGGWYGTKTQEHPLTMARALRVMTERTGSIPIGVSVLHNPVMNWMVDGAVVKIAGNPKAGRKWLIPDPAANPEAFIDGVVAWVMSINLMDWKPEEDYSTDDMASMISGMKSVLAVQ